MRRAVNWSLDALDDVDAVAGYIAADDPDAADLVVDRIEQTGEKLGQFASGHPGRVSGVYEKRIDKTRYIIAYAIERDQPIETIVILRVIHTARDWRDEDWPA